jgi:enoyl-CoA hydratase/carnithine racemase
MASPLPKWKYVSIEAGEGAPGVYVVTMNKPPENRLDVESAQNIISALRYIEKVLLGPGKPGAVIITSSSDKFFCTGVDLEEAARDPLSSADGFFPLLATLLDYPYPTIAAITGHTFGGACPFSLSCDYRLMNRKRGFFCMPPVNLGLHFDGIGFLPRLKLSPQVARKMLLEAHRWTADTAVADGIIDEAVTPDQLLPRALEKAKEIAPRAKMGVYGLLRNELFGEASRQFQQLAYRHHRASSQPIRVKI